MVAQFKIRDKVSEFVEMSAVAPVKCFYPTAVAKFAEYSITDVFPFLMDLTKSGELSLKWELRCPEYHCNQKINNENVEINDEVECPKCGYEFIVNENDLYPRFDINHSYKQYMRDKYTFDKKKSILTLRS